MTWTYTTSGDVTSASWSYYNAEGKVHCLLKGSDEEAIRRHHAALDGFQAGGSRPPEVLRRRPSSR